MNKLINKAFKQLLTMVILTLITQGVSLLKTSVTAANFGASVDMDAFNFANSIGTFVFSFIGTGVTTVLIPTMISKKNNKSINNFITVLYGISIICVFIIFINRRLIVLIFSSGDNRFIEVTCSIMFITLLSQFFNTILGVFNAVFQCKEKFNVPKFITLITTALLTFLVILNKGLSIYQYALYIFIIAILNVVIQGVFVYKYGFRYRWTIDLKDEDFKSMIRIFIPTMFSSGLYQISLLIDSMISSGLGAGQISILTYSNTIMTMINSLLVGNIMMYIYPKIAKEINKRSGKKQLFDYITFFNALMCLVVVGFIVVGKEGVTLLYQRGKFDNSITNIVYICSLISIIGVPIDVMRDSIYRYFYAKGNTKTTFINSVIASIVNIVTSIVLSKFIGLYGVVLGTVVTSIFSLTSILIRMNNKYVININKKYFLKENLKIFLSSLISVIVLLILKSLLNINNIIINIALYGVITIVLYLTLLILFRSKINKIKL